jgi:uncharacterized protein (TIGR03435 family)
MRTFTPARIAAAALFACFSCLAQPSGPGPVFDVASIRPAVPVRPDVQTEPGSLTIRNQSLRFLVQWAYDVPPFQITGPAWLNDSRFDVVAKASGGGDEAKLRLMLRALLADRFSVTTHTEQKEMQVYAITLAKGGPKFQESTTEGPPVFDRAGPTMLTARHVTIKDLAVQISEPLKRPVIDDTGLKGKYDIKIDISSYMQEAAAAGGKGDGGGGQPDVMSILFTGLQQQLGVKLESRRQNVDILVIDSANKTPTEN